MTATLDAETFLARGILAMGLVFENEAAVLARLNRYFDELQKWNKKVNLVARSLNDEQVLENHFLDSLSLLSLLPLSTRQRETVLDIGTGAGFPGLVLKAACPNLRVTLVEPRKNRYFFLKHIVRLLELTNLAGTGRAQLFLCHEPGLHRYRSLCETRRSLPGRGGQNSPDEGSRRNRGIG
jgi:16S rRNA (guanine527-N7)-methyltransferase